MIDIVTKLPTMPAELQRARMARKIHGSRPGVRVVPADDPTDKKRWTADDMRRLLRHPRAGGFRSEGSIEWPNDTFTQRRLRDGSVMLEAAEHKPAAEQRLKPPS